jgi:hypothetical protein
MPGDMLTESNDEPSLLVAVPVDEDNNPVFHLPIPDCAATLGQNPNNFDPTPVGLYNVIRLAGLPSDSRLLRSYAAFHNAGIAFLCAGNSNKLLTTIPGTFHPLRHALYRDTLSNLPRLEWAKDFHRLTIDTV